MLNIPRLELIAFTFVFQYDDDSYRSSYGEVKVLDWYCWTDSQISLWEHAS